MSVRLFKIFRGDKTSGKMNEYKIDIDKGMVVLDASTEFRQNRRVTWLSGGTVRPESVDPVVWKLMERLSCPV